MAKQERTRKSAPQNKVKSYEAAKIRIEPWVELDEAELRVFDAVINAREKETWADADVEAATKLARVAVELDALWEDYKETGPVIINKRGTPVPNPVLTAHGNLMGTYRQLRLALGLTANQRGISGSKQGKRNLQDAQAAKEPENESKITSLIPRA